MTTINLTSTSGFLQADFEQMKDLLQDGGVEGVTITAASLVTTAGVDVDTLNTNMLSNSTDIGTNTTNISTNTTNIALKADLDSSILSKSGTYEVASGDAGKIIECDGTFTVTFPNSLDTGFNVIITNVGSGTITIAATTTLQTKASAVTLPNQYGAATAYHRGSNVWLAFGDLE